METRRVGSMTFGLCCILYGILFLLRTFWHNISFGFILKLWPIILIALGMEVIISYIMAKNREIKYDGWAVIMMMAVMVFALGMGGMEFLLEHANTTIQF